MKALRFSAAFILLAIAVLTSSPVKASTVLQMNLAQMLDRSEKVFVGTVIDVTESRIEVGGGEIPAVTYTFRVGDTFKGSYQEVKGVKTTTVSMLGSLQHLKTGKHPILDFPLLQANQEYLLIVGPAGPIGLTAPIGLGQGNFSLLGDEGEKVALNGAQNVGLFSGMNVGIPDGVPVSYTELSALISDIVGGAE